MVEATPMLVDLTAIGTLVIGLLCTIIPLFSLAMIHHVLSR